MPMRSSDSVSGLSASHQLYVMLCVLFVTALVVANVAGGKLFVIGPWEWLPLLATGRILPTGILTFPLTFVLTDLINEFYGKKGAAFVTWLGLAMSLFVYGILWVSIHVHASPKSPLSDAIFQQVFGGSNRLILASLVAYVIGQFLDIHLFQIFRFFTRDRHLWIRATGSTVVSQLIDSIVVTFISFGAKLSFSDTLGLALNSYVIKFFLAVAMTPLLYFGRMGIEALLKPDYHSSEPISSLGELGPSIEEASV